MRAVNLMPAGASRGNGLATGGFGPAYAVVGVLVAVLAMVVLYVTSSNSIAQKRAQLSSLQQQVSQARALAARLTPYSTFAQLTETRVATVRQISSSRFDWHAALSDLAQVMPAGAALQSLTATVAPGASVSGAGGAAGGLGTSGLRAAINAPAFEMHGCDRSQDDVARLMSRLRVMNGVQRVTLADSLRQNPTQAGGSTTVVNPGSTASAVRSVCGTHPALFDLVVFFAPLPGAATTAGGSGAVPASPAGSAPVSTGPASATTASPAGTAASGAAPTAGSTAARGTVPASRSTPAGAQPLAGRPAGTGATAGVGAQPVSTATTGSLR